MDTVGGESVYSPCSLLAWRGCDTEAVACSSGIRAGVAVAGWHAVEQASFLATGFFSGGQSSGRGRTARNPEWLILLYLFLATLPCDILSGFLVFCDRVIYPVYFSSSQPFGLSALEDQQCAGALMWTCVTLVYLIAGTVFAARFALAPWIRKSGRYCNRVGTQCDRTASSGWRLSECPASP